MCDASTTSASLHSGNAAAQVIFPRRREEKNALLAQLVHEKERENKLASVVHALPVGEPLPVTIEGLRKVHVPFVQRINNKGLPIKYGDAFYSTALQSAPWAKVALWDGCVVGAIVCKKSDEIDRCIHICSIVASITRRRVASEMLRAVFEESRLRGFVKSSLRVHVRNTGAIAFYSRWGFRVVETLIGYYKYSKDALEAPPDALLMVREADLPLELVETLPSSEEVTISSPTRGESDDAKKRRVSTEVCKK